MRETVKVSKIFLLIEKFQKLDRSLIYMILVIRINKYFIFVFNR
jgi:hypothetical protein